MPYIITTRPAADPPNEQHGVKAEVLSRRPVATLDDAQWAVMLTIAQQNWEAEGGTGPAAATPAERDQADEAIGPDGGTIGPLPDGTVIEVELTTWATIDGLKP